MVVVQFMTMHLIVHSGHPFFHQNTHQVCRVLIHINGFFVSAKMSAPNDVLPTDYQIRLELFGFERGFLEGYVDNALDMIRRAHPTVQFQSHSMLTYHKIIQFSSTSHCSTVPAFDFFKFNIQLVQSINPPELYFSCAFPQGISFFPGSRQIMSPHQPTDVEHTILNFNTSNGRLSTPPTKYSQESKIIVHEFSLHLLKENLSFSVSPFVEWRQVESKYGCLTFPNMSNPNLSPPPAFQQPAPENYQKYSTVQGRTRKDRSFVVPPPRHGSWSVQQSQDWEMASFDLVGPERNNPPFERRHYQKLAPQSVQPPSRFDYLDSFRNQRHWGNWGKNRHDYHEVVEPAPPVQPAQSAPTNLPVSTASAKPITETSPVPEGQNNSLTTDVQIPHVPVSTFSLDTPIIPRPGNSTFRHRRPSQVDDGTVTPPLSSSLLRTAEPTGPTQTQAAAALADPSTLDLQQFLEVPVTPPTTVVPGTNNADIIDSRPRVKKLSSATPGSMLLTQSNKTPKVSQREEVTGVKTRLQDKQEESSILAAWLEKAKIKQVYKDGDEMPAFLESYSDKILQRANAHEPPDDIAQCLSPFLFLRDGQYVLDKSAITCKTMNILDSLYVFEKESNHQPHKLATWFNQVLRGQKL